MPFSLCIIDGHFWSSCRHSQEDYAKNLATTARTIHSPEQKETIHMISMLRKEACSGSTHDLAHMPTQNCLADCLTKASGKADNLITARKTRRLLDVDIHTDFRTFMEHKAFLSAWCRTFMHTKEKNVFFWNDLKISVALTPREGFFHVTFVRTHPCFEDQDSTKITSALADSQRPDASSKPRLVTQQVHAPSDNRGCVQPCEDDRTPRRTPCTQTAGRTPQRDHLCVWSTHAEKDDPSSLSGPVPRWQPPLGNTRAFDYYVSTTCSPSGRC